MGVMEMLERTRLGTRRHSVYAECGQKGKARMARHHQPQLRGVIRVASDWRPDGWLADYDLKTVQEAEAAVTDARDALNAMHRVQAVSEADAQRAKDAADSPCRQRVSEWKKHNACTQRFWRNATPSLLRRRR